ncbi:hypothetical protein A7P54_08170 [Acinetobacter sp. Ac_3412]|uniref:hypothetical protein n=1 Tax=Acinetobacter sp. Ac_3412 TaxID=1848935 RepID=UPI001490605E|nr:hypothetical protein [Acinetobacter sp. Ac_3412]NNP76394.1 hypothetical protein [Acinetobacter sp. Ac_3412]
MSSLFYIWDATQHHPNISINTLEQAEYYATNSQAIGFTDKLKTWLLDVESIVTDPELSVNFDEEIIASFTNVKRYFDAVDNVFKIEQGLLFKSKYLYKVLVETLRQHGLVAFDARSYHFFSKEKIFPEQESMERMLDAVKPLTKEQLEQFKAIPPSSEMLSIFAKQWLDLNKESLNFTRKTKKNQFNQLNRYCRDFDFQLYEDISIICSNKSNIISYQEVNLLTYIQVSVEKAIRILRQHPIDGHTLQYLPDLHGITGEPSSFNDPKQLQHVLQQVHDFLIYDAEKHQDIKILNQWLNHGDEKEYISGLGAISRLVLAKYVNDPLYDQLVAEALTYVHRNRFFKNMTEEQFHERLEQEIKNTLEV